MSTDCYFLSWYTSYQQRVQLPFCDQKKSQNPCYNWWTDG